MHLVSTPEEWAAALVTIARRIPGGPLFVKLSSPGAEAVLLGPYRNPNVAKKKAESLRRFICALLKEAAPAGGPSEVS